MALFRPSRILRRVWDIDRAYLERNGILALLLDLDNTLTTHNNPSTDFRVMDWLDDMKKSGIHLVLVSNNSDGRVKLFADKLGLGFTSRACKPLPFGFKRAAKRLKLRPDQTAVVGDQIFTDIAGGNLFGAVTIFVEPMEPEKGLFFRFKRRLEKRLLTTYRK